MNTDIFCSERILLSLDFCQQMIIYAIKHNNMKYAEMLKNVIYLPDVQTIENSLKNGEDEEVIEKVLLFHGPDIFLRDIVCKNCDLLLELFFKQKWHHNVPILNYLVKCGKNKYIRQYLDTFGVGVWTLKGMVTNRVSYTDIDRLIKESSRPCTRKILSSYLPWAPVRFWEEFTTSFFEV